MKSLLKFGGQTMCHLQCFIFINSHWHQSIAKKQAFKRIRNDRKYNLHLYIYYDMTLYNIIRHQYKIVSTRFLIISASKSEKNINIFLPKSFDHLGCNAS